jgi:hypothetical protein
VATRVALPIALAVALPDALAAGVDGAALAVALPHTTAFATSNAAPLTLAAELPRLAVGDHLAGVELHLAGALAVGFGLHIGLALWGSSDHTQLQPLTQDGVDLPRDRFAGTLRATARSRLWRHLLRREAEIGAHALAGLLRHGVELCRYGRDVLRGLDEGADLGVGASVAPALLRPANFPWQLTTNRATGARASAPRARDAVVIADDYS